MSEKIIQALIKLFAIFARGDNSTANKMDIVHAFIGSILNNELALKYLPTFHDEYEEVLTDIARITATSNKTGDALRFKIEGKLATRIHKICNEINQELTQKQKYFVVVSILDFINANNEYNEINESEQEFLQIIIDDLNLDTEEYKELKEFILSPVEQIQESPNVLIIQNTNHTEKSDVKCITVDNFRGFIKIFYLNSPNILILRANKKTDITINGQPIYYDKSNIISVGATIRSNKSKAIYYSEILNKFTVDNSQAGVVLKTTNIDYVFRGGNIGLQSVNIEEESGNLVGIMGASGAGKSTLLNILNGTLKPRNGSVLINNIDLHNDKEGLLQGLIGFVPQDDLLIKELSVYENLYYNAKLCFDNLTEEEIEEKVNRVLHNLGLFERKNNIVGDELRKEISGGQRKRLNIALELIREPSILYLDEPTSGLSSKDSENIMDLLKDLALKGKLIFVVIHQPSSEIFKAFDKLLILDTGGYQIYYGSPIDSLVYFKKQMSQADWFISECPTCGNVNPEQIFNITEAKVLTENGTPMLNQKGQEIRKVSPLDWFKIYKEKIDTQIEEQCKIIPKELPQITFKIPNWFRQLKVFIIRDVLSKISNKQYMLINSLESPLIAVFLAFIIKYWDVDESSKIQYTFMNNDNIPVYIFMLVICAFFIGLTVSAEEIFRDQKIRKRESFLNLSWSSYLTSKILILFTISALQSLLFVLLGNIILEVEGMFFEYWLISFSVWCFANVIGLIISDSFNDIKTIYILIPFMVIPQIILSGIMVSFDKLNPKISNPRDIPFYGEVITSRWAYEALTTYQYTHNNYEKLFYSLNKKISDYSYRKGEWSNQLINKLNDCERLLETKNIEEIQKRISVIKHELELEQKNTNFRFGNLKKINANTLTLFEINKLRDFITQIRQHYISLNNKYRDEKDLLTDNLIHKMGVEVCSELNIPNSSQNKHIIDSIGNTYFLSLKERNFNEKLDEFCKNSNDLTVLIEHKGEFVQKIDPIFQFPQNTFLKAHFYAPVKPLFGYYIITFWANLIVIWFMTIISYVLLYFRVFRKVLDYIDNLRYKKAKQA